MSKVATLKKQAADFEQKKQFDKALAVYVKLLDSFDEYAAELDVALFNRVGDLMLRQGNVADAVDYYEKAVDRYADTGFFNNAIALCNKILRQSPGRASVYYKLGKISAQKGFKADAKTNFLEYADRMQKAGKVDEAFRALKEFADLCPDQDEIRLMLADQLTKADRKDEGIEQLQILHARYDSEGRSADAQSIADRIRAIDPAVELRADGHSQGKSKSSDLIFLDLDAPSPVRSATPISRPVEPPPPPIAPPTPPRAATPLRAVTPIAPPPAVQTPPTPHMVTPPADMEAPLSGITRIGDDAVDLTKTPSESLLGLESTHLADSDIIKSTPTGSLLDLEPTSFADTPVSNEIHLTPPEPIHRSSAPTRANAERETPTGGDLDFIMPDTPAATPARSATPSIDFETDALTTPHLPVPPLARETSVRETPIRETEVHPSPLDGLPLMDLDVPPAPPVRTPIETPRRITTSLDEIALSDDLELIDLPADAAIPSPAPTPVEPVELIDLNAESLTLDDEPVTVPTPSVARRSTMVALQAVEVLQASVEGEPGNWSLRRELAEAMLEAGDRDGGLRELEAAMSGAEHAGDLDLASSLADEIARLEPEAVKHHQKRVEYAYRTNDRPRLIEAYLSLGDALLRADQTDKARSIYQRVIDLAPDEARARAALDTIVVPEPEPAPPAPRGSSGARRTTAFQVPDEPAPAAPASNDFINLGDWLRDDEEPKDTRMVVAEQEPTGDEDADFQDMLRKFKQGVAENVDAEDYQSHYDLAIAFKEMGLLDEAIAEFQKALGGSANRLPTYEALGQCFLDKSQPKLATSILNRALNEQASEDQLVGVLYLLGRAHEEQGNAAEALAFYQRVFVLDIQFRDIADRMSELERVAR